MFCVFLSLIFVYGRENISDTSNWMSFVRQANNYNEQNLILIQQERMLYYVTIKNIHPKQELKVNIQISSCFFCF